jgi:membrane protein
MKDSRAELGFSRFWTSLPHRFVATERLLRRSVLSAMEHDALTVAQAAAYSAVVALFPALIVAAAVVGFLPDTQPLRIQLALFFDHILPSNVSPVLAAYFTTSHKNPQTARAIFSAAVVSVVGAASVMATLMEGFRRAHRLPLPRRSFWPRRLRALVLVPLSLLPMTFATLLVVFGHYITVWLAGALTVDARHSFYFVAVILRWSIAVAGSVGIIAVIYHLGTDVSRQVREHLEPLLREPHHVLSRALHGEWSWRSSLPGAALATALWFVTTLLFGLYVTRFANYSQVYGSLGAAIALMVWLYLIALCVLIGSEFNAQLAVERRLKARRSDAAKPAVEEPTAGNIPKMPSDR